MEWPTPAPAVLPRDGGVPAPVELVDIMQSTKVRLRVVGFGDLVKDVNSRRRIYVVACPTAGSMTYDATAVE